MTNKPSLRTSAPSLSKLSLGAAMLMLGSAATAATVVATRNFDSPDFTLAGVTATGTAGGGVSVGTQSIANFGASMFRNNTTGLWSITLANLPAHTSVSIDIDLAFLDSWDSLNGTVTPDLLTWSIDGATTKVLTANNASGTVNDFAGGTVVQGPANVWGIQWNDRIVDMSTSTLATFAHTNSTLTFGLRAGGAGWQGGTDESWAFDNLVISIEPVISAIPEPATWAMLIAGFGLVGTSLRLRNKEAGFTACRRGGIASA